MVSKRWNIKLKIDVLKDTFQEFSGSRKFLVLFDLFL